MKQDKLIAPAPAFAPLSHAGPSSKPYRLVRSRTPEHGAAPVGALDRWLVSLLQRVLGGVPVRLVLWDGSAAPVSATPVATVTFKQRSALVKVLCNPELNFGEAFTAGTLEVRGDLVALAEAVNRAAEARQYNPFALPPWLTWPNTFRLARANIHHHYDIGNDFYRLWLDDELLYTCAYFDSQLMTLEQAQIAKMDHVCRKLRLQPGERVVEAGCGWGALALHMAREYGVHVRAFNISREQILYASERANREGLADRVEFVEDDYRNIAGTFDAFVSVGMLEHVGRDHYRALGQVINRTIHPDHGRGLLHFIGRNRPRRLNAWIRRRIFPGAYPPALAEVTRTVLEPWSFSVVDVENLRLHYARTLGHWLGRFDQAAGRIRTMFDEEFVRAWRLYLAGSKAAFTTGWLQLFQITFARPAHNGIAWTRADLYQASGSGLQASGSEPGTWGLKPGPGGA